MYCGFAHTSQSCSDTRPQTDALTPSADDVDLRFAAVGGPAFAVRARRQSKLDWPKLVPIAPPGTGSWIRFIEPEHLAVRLSTVIRAAKRGDSRTEFRECIGATPPTHVILNCITDDQALETCWPQWRQISATLPALGIDAAIAPAYSTWGDDNPLYHVFNAKRSIVAFDLLQRSRIPTVPTIAAYWESQWQAWTEWLKANEVLHTIAFDFGTLSHRRFNSDLKRSVDKLNQLIDAVGRRMTIVVSGALAPVRLATVKALQADLIHLESQPLYKANSGLAFSNDPFRWVPTSMPRSQLAQQNVCSVARYLNGQRTKDQSILARVFDEAGSGFESMLLDSSALSGMEPVGP